MAAARDVAIGAQVSYRDLAGFGRRRIDYEFGELRDDILYQLAALDGLARVAGSRVSYLKPHGALYNVAAVDAVQAEAVVAAVAEYDFALPILTLPDSELARQATRVGLRVIAGRLRRPCLHRGGAAGPAIGAGRGADRGGRDRRAGRRDGPRIDHRHRRSDRAGAGDVDLCAR